MSKEREMLKECVLILDHPFNGTRAIKVAHKIKELLAQPEPLSKEAIRAIVNQLPTEVDLDTGIEFCKIIEKAHGIGGEEFLKGKLKPLSEQEIYNLDRKSHQPYALYNVRECIHWIRMVEKAHGITGETE